MSMSTITHPRDAGVAVWAPQMAEEGSAALSSGGGGGAHAGPRAARGSTLGLYAHAFAALTASRQLLPPPPRAAMLTELDANIEVSGARWGLDGASYVCLKRQGD